LSNDEIRQNRKKELVQKFKIIRGSKYSVAVKIRLNLDEEVEKIKEAFNPTLSILGILASRVDLRTRHSGEVLESLREHFGGQVFRSFIRENV
jgi:cellulose biosynthesis protein BcsQ